MNTVVDESTLRAADAEAVMAHFLEGTPVPEEVVERVRRRSERISEEIRRKFGSVDVAVDLIRQGRDEA